MTETVGHTTREEKKTTTTATKKEDNTPVLGPTLEVIGGLIGQVGYTGLAIMSVAALTALIGNVWIAIGGCLAVGVAMQLGGYYLTLRKQGKQNQFKFVNALFGRPAEAQPVAQAA
jgi:hypothetical protein